MVSIFEDFDRLSENDLRIELALVKNVSISNVAKETGNRMVGALAKMVSSVVQTVSKDYPADYEVVKMSDIVKHDYNELSVVNKEELKERLKSALTQKCASLAKQGEILTEERASYIIVSEAAKMYDIPKYASFTNKIHDICIYYYKDLIMAIHEMIKRQSPQEAEEFDRMLQARLDIISLEAKRDLSKRLFPKEFSGRGIARVLRLERHTQYLEIAISIMGIECFDYISAYAYTAASSLKGFNRISRCVYGQLVWKLYNNPENMPSYTKIKLPSYVNTVEAVSISAKENQFRQLLKRRIEADKEVERLKAQLEKSILEKDKALEKLTALQENYDSAAEEFEKLEKDKDVYMSGIRPEQETKKYYSQVNSVKRQMDADRAAIESIQQKYTDLVAKNLESDKDIKKKELENERLHEQTNRQLLDETADIKRRWDTFYKGISFDDGVYGQVVLAFGREDLLIIEQILLEFMELKDKNAFDTEQGVIYCSISSGNNTARIVHDGDKIMSVSR